MYNEFVDIIKAEMCSKLSYKKVVLQNGYRNKKRKCKKPWWNNILPQMWNDVCKFESMWLKSKVRSEKSDFRQQYIHKRKCFDREVQKSKRQYWFKVQDELNSVCSLLGGNGYLF